MSRGLYKDKKFTCYAIQHNSTGRIYVGISCNPQDRIYHHLLQLRKHTHPNKEMLADYNTYGNDYSFFTLQENVCLADRYDVESKWMNELETYNTEIDYNSKDKRFNKFVDMQKVKIIKGIPTTNKKSKKVVRLGGEIRGANENISSV